jgi:hypothetical protein
MEAMTSNGVDGLSNAMLSIVSEEDQIALLHHHLDRYCHRFRNRLNSLKLCLFMGKKSLGESEFDKGQWQELETLYQVLENLMEQFQQYCRPSEVHPMEVSLRSFVQELRGTWSHRLSNREIQVEFHSTDCRSKCQLDLARMTLGLDALANWRGSVLPPGSTIVLNCWEDQGSFWLSWEESEPLPSARDDSDDEVAANIALPVLARILHAHGGTLEVTHQEPFRLLLRWPNLQANSSKIKSTSNEVNR